MPEESGISFSVFPIAGGPRHRATAQMPVAGGRTQPKSFEAVTYELAEERMRDWLRKNRRLTPSSVMKVGDMLDAYIIRCEARSRAKGTIEDYEGIIRRTLKPKLGHKRICDLSTADVEDVILELPVKEGINTRALLRAAINKIARKVDPNLPNVAALAEPETYHPAEQVQLIEENFAKILAAEMDPVRYAMWLFLADVGPRPHIVRDLMWFELQRRKDGLWLQSDRAKTPEGKKPVPVAKHVARFVERLPKTGIYVFPNPKTQKPYNETTWRGYWLEAQEAAGVPATTLYQLRHFFGTVQASKQKDHVLKRLMTHSDIRTTKQYYVDAFDQELRKAVDED